MENNENNLKNNSDDQWLTIDEASNLLHVTKATLRNWERNGKINPPKRTIGGQRRYKKSDLENFMK